ncbi:MAG: DNA recombination protein RecN [Campylobacterota bacterium]|nr:DNA recombination protein RecN [Campylobacterota bacterium]
MSIQRLYLKELLTFDESELEFDSGLIVLTGPSGAGKSVLMQSVLSSFGYGSSEARVCEVTLARPKQVRSEAYELDDELVIRSLKKDRTRFYLNGQNIPRKALQSLFSATINYLSVRDKSGFESTTLLELLDDSLRSHNITYKKLFKEYRKRYANYRIKLSELTKIREDEKRLAELIEYTTYEIEKIKGINPKEGEDEKLMRVKQQLSRIDKINDALSRADEIFSLEESVYEVFRLLGKDESYFGDAMSQLRADFEETQTLAEELADIDVGEVLDRLEKISGLKNRYGSISEALDYLNLKEKELAGYQTIEQDKSMLESFLSLEYSELMVMAQQISRARESEAVRVEKELMRYLADLKLPAARFVFGQEDLGESGIDSLDLQMGHSATSTLSGGEFNRLRLALLVVAMEGKREEGGVIILDEIDANVSGDESIAIAAMISKLSAAYQIFAISHQAHLSALADQHILVSREDGGSQAKVLDDEERIREISRIIGGENSDEEAIAFARKLRKRL